MDNDTVHIKILDDDHPKQNIFTHDDDNHHESDMMRSIKMLVGGTGMTVKSSKNEIFDDQNGAIDLNQIKLSMPGGIGVSSSIVSSHKRGMSGV